MSATTAHVADAVLRVVIAWESRVGVLEECHLVDHAALLADVCREVREAVEEHRPDWLDVADACERTGFGPDTIRTRARELRDSGLAKKEGGRWLIERGAVERMRTRGQSIDVSEWRSAPRTVARRLAREG